MAYWIAQGIPRFVLSPGYKHQVFQEHFDPSWRGTALAYAVEARPLGTGGGLPRARRLLGASESFLLLNGDTFFEVDLKTLWAFHESNQAEITLSLRPGGGTDLRGTIVETDSSRRITALDRTNGQSTVEINGGVSLIAAEALAAFAEPEETPCSFENDLLRELLRRERRLFGYPCDGRFIDIGTPEDYARATAVLSE